MSNRQGPSRAKAQTAGKIDDDIKDKVLALLNDFPRIPSICWHDFYYYKFNEVFCAADLGFDHGLAGFMKSLEYMVDEKLSDQGMVSYSLKGNYKDRYIELTDATGQIVPNKDLETIGHSHIARQLFDDSELWREKFNYLKPLAGAIRIVLSPLEQVYKRDSQAVKNQVDRIRETMQRFPEGLKLNEISRYVKISPLLLNQLSIESLVVEYPELFYRVDPPEGEDGKYEEPVVFDGFVHTLPENQLKAKFDIDSIKLVFFTVNSGLYHKTLLLLNKAGHQGLKITVWFDSIRQNFSSMDEKKHDDPDVEDPLDAPAIELAKALHSFSLVTIRSDSKIKNDLRLFFPHTKPNFVELMGKLSYHISQHRRSPSSGSASLVSSPEQANSSESGLMSISGTSGSC